MVQIAYYEVQEIRKVYPHKHFIMTSDQKPAPARNYYLNCDDYESLKIISKLRNKSIKEIANEIKE